MDNPTSLSQHDQSQLDSLGARLLALEARLDAANVGVRTAVVKTLTVDQESGLAQLSKMGIPQDAIDLARAQLLAETPATPLNQLQQRTVSLVEAGPAPYVSAAPGGFVRPVVG